MKTNPIELLEKAREVLLHFTEAPDFNEQHREVYDEIANFLDRRDDVDEVEEARLFLEGKGYYTRNLWTDIDVTDRFECTSEEAIEVLDVVMQGEWLIGQIHELIESQCEDNGFIEKTEEDEHNQIS